MASLFHGIKPAGSDLLAATLGFCFWNFPKAKIFMGMWGVALPGLIIGGIILASLIQGLVSIWFWVTLLGVFGWTLLALLRRAMKRKYFWQAHRSHAYQILARRWQSHAKVSALVGASISDGCFPWL